MRSRFSIATQNKGPNMKWDLSTRADNEQLAQLRSTIESCYDAADWHGAFRAADKIAHILPWNVEARISRAALLGDWGETFIGRQRLVRKAAALRGLRYWVHKAPLKLTLGLRNYARNELYYHSGHAKAQALLGRERVQRGESRANYSYGVGAACHAIKLIGKGNIAVGQRWAERSVEAWTDYFATKPARDRFDTHCFLALALAALGKFAESERELGVVAKLIGKDVRTTSIYDIAERIDVCRRRIAI